MSILIDLFTIMIFISINNGLIEILLLIFFSDIFLTALECLISNKKHYNSG